MVFCFPPEKYSSFCYLFFQFALVKYLLMSLHFSGVSGYPVNPSPGNLNLIDPTVQDDTVQSPTNQDPEASGSSNQPSAIPNLLVSEVTTNLGDKSYVEIRSPSGIKGPTYKHYEVTVLKVVNKKIQIQAIFSIPSTMLKEDPFFILIGDPNQDLIIEKDMLSGTIKCPPGLDAEKKVYCRLDKFMEISDFSFIGVIVTESDEKIELPANQQASRGIMYLNELKSFKTHLIDNQIDSVVLKNHGIIQKCDLLQDLFPVFGKNPKYLKAIPNPDSTRPLSWSRCGGLNTAHDSSQYKLGMATPGRINDCSKPSQDLDLTEFVRVLPTNQEHEHPCNVPFEANSLSENQVDAPAIGQAMKRVRETDDDPEFCSAPVKEDAAGKYLVNVAKTAKRMKVLEGKASRNAPNSETNEEPTETVETSSKNPIDDTEEGQEVTAEEDDDTEVVDEPIILDPEALERKSKMEHVSMLIEKHQKTLLPVKLIKKHWNWFAYNFNKDSPPLSTYFCSLCAKYLPTTSFDNLLDNEQGLLKESYDENRRIIREHAKRDSHIIAKQLDEIEKSLKIDGIRAREIWDGIEDVETANQMLSVYYDSKHYHSFEHHVPMLKLLKIFHVKVGEGCNTPEAAKRMNRFMSKYFLNEFIEDFKSSDGPAYMIIDGSDDKAGNHHQVILFQFLSK